MQPYSENFYRAELARYFDLMHRHRDYDRECDFAHALIRKTGPGIKKVLDICCGTGEHALRMARLGYEVTGIDLSQDMIDIARRKAADARLEIRFECRDVMNPGFSDEFQAAYCLGHSLLYMTTYPKAHAFFQTVHESLSGKGPFLVDFINGWGLIDGIDRDKCVYQDEETTIFQFEQATLEKKKRIAHIDFYYLIDSLDGNVKTVYAEEDLRIFFPDEVQLLLGQAGFEDMKTHADYDTAGSAEGDTIIISARKSS